MEVLITSNKQDELNDLLKWLNAEHIEGVDIKAHDNNTDSKHMGAETYLALTIIIGKYVLPHLAQLINTWIIERKPKSEIELTDKKTGQTIKMSTENLANTEDVVIEFLSKLR